MLVFLKKTLLNISNESDNYSEKKKKILFTVNGS